MSDHWTDRLSEYLDGELSAAERLELEVHLAECEECTATVEQLSGVVGRARSLADRPPVSDLWSGIAERIGATSAGAVADLDEHRRSKARLSERRLTFSLPQLAAASIALMVLSSGTAWLVSGSRSAAVEETAQVEIPGSALVGMPAASYTLSEYDVAISQLERALESNRAQLDTATVRVIEENLMVIDLAIAQAQRALAQDPASGYLREHLAVTMRQKLEFLRQATQMAGSVS
jgi:anti-sigma factor RsiW